MSFYNKFFNIKPNEGLYGSASYMSRWELRTFFHSKSSGISLDGKKHLKPEFTKLNTLVICPTGGGKSTLIKGNILQKSMKYPHSFWVIDPASDIYRDTHKWLEKQGFITKVINLDDASKSLKINILLVAARTPNGIEDLASLFILIQYDGVNSGDPFWRDSAQNLLILLMRAVVSSSQNEYTKTLHTVYMLLNWFGVEQEKLDRFILTHLRNNQRMKDEYKSLIANSSENSKVLLSVVSTAKSAIAKLVTNETISEIISDDNFDVETLRKVTQGIFIQVREDRLNHSGVKAMLSILNKFLLAQCMRLPEKGEQQLDVHAYIDEAGAFYLQNLDSYIVVMRKRNVSIMLFLQDLFQLDMYGFAKKKIIASNCLNKLIYPAVSPEDAAWASNLVGSETKEILDRPVGIPLISAQQIRDLPKNHFLYIHKTKATILVTKPWYKQWTLTKRSRL